MESLLTDTLISGSQLCLRPPLQTPFFSTPKRTLYFYIPVSASTLVMDIFFPSRGCPALMTASTVVQFNGLDSNSRQTEFWFSIKQLLSTVLTMEILHIPFNEVSAFKFLMSTRRRSTFAFMVLRSYRKMFRSVTS